tara:strand:- start:9582 stop:11207 length:1626 start_codon:yes stop_codon:yes gene_type:complete
MKFNVKITNLSFDMEMEEIKDNVTPPVVDPPVIDPPVVTPMPSEYIFLEDFEGNTSQKFHQALKQEGKILRLLDNTTYQITQYIQQEPKIKAIVGNNTDLIFTTIYEEIFLFQNDNPKFGSVGVNWLQSGEIKEATVQPTKALFRSVRDQVKTGMLAMIGSKVPDDKTLGINLARFVYSGSDSDTDFLYVIGKDIKTNGADFMHLKAPNGGNLYSVLENVEVHNPIVKFPATHLYNPTTIKSSGIYDGKYYKITSDNTASQVLTWHGYQNGTIRTIINIGRYVWNVGNGVVGNDDKTIFLNNPETGLEYKYSKISETSFYSSAEFQAGDVTSFGTIKSKQIDHGQYNWVYEVDTNFVDGTLYFYESSIHLPENVEAELTYKGNSLISPHPITVNSNFGDQDINQSAGYGWTAYNQKEITVFWKNVKLEGFYRQSTGQVGSSKGYNLQHYLIDDETVIVDSKIFLSTNDYDVGVLTPLGEITDKEPEGQVSTSGWVYTVRESIYETVFGIEGAEFNPQEPVTHSGDMPEEAANFIEWLESLE